MELTDAPIALDKDLPGFKLTSVRQNLKGSKTKRLGAKGPLKSLPSLSEESYSSMARSSFLDSHHDGFIFGSHSQVVSAEEGLHSTGGLSFGTPVADDALPVSLPPVS